MPNANLILAARMADIEAFHVMDVQNRAQELEATGRRIVHMEIGQPDFAAPPLVAQAAIEAIPSAAWVTRLRSAFQSCARPFPTTIVNGSA